jgi:transcriptional regulator with XRE-family HTH domain
MFGWARASAHLDVEEIARVLGVKPARWVEWERGESAPTMVQLRKLADTIRQPIGVFFLPEPPAIVDPAVALRRLPGGAHPSRALLVEARRALARREIALDLLADEQEGALGPALSSVRVSRDDDVEVAAARLRETLGVSLDEQRGSSWPIGVWREAVERAGVLVFETRDLDIADARGFALPEQPLPVIVLNGRDAPTARLFTLVHECVHLALGEGSVCDGPPSRRATR